MGGTRRIGRWAAEALAVAGHSVHALYQRDDTAATEFSAAMAQGGLNITLHRVDALERTLLGDTVALIAGEEGSIGILVNSMGPAAQGRLSAIDPLELERLWRGNVLAVHHSVQACLPYLRIAGGRIVNFLSIGADSNKAFSDVPAYAACKAMLASYSRSLARELASEGITVNCIAPGITAQPADGAPSLDAARLPTGRQVEQEDIAAALWYLTGPASGQVTGTVINLSGGFAL